MSNQSNDSEGGTLNNNNQEQKQEEETGGNIQPDLQIPAAVQQRGLVSISTSNTSSLQQATGTSGSEGAAASTEQVAAPVAAAMHLEEQQQGGGGVARARSRSASSSKSGRGKKTKIDTADDIARLKRESNILSSLPDPVLAIDIDGSITFANLKMEQLLQLPFDDLLGSNIELFIASDSVEGYQKMIQDVLSYEGRYGFEAEDDTMAGDDSNERNGGSNGSRSGSRPNGGRSGSHGRGDQLQAAQRHSPMLEVKVDSAEDITDSSGNPLKKHAYETKHKTSFGTDDSEEFPPGKKTKFSADGAMSSNEGIAAYAADVEMEEGKQDVKPPAEKLQHHQGQRLGPKHVSTSGTSSSLTGGTFSSPPEKQDSQSSSIDSSSSNKAAKGKSPNSSDSGYGESNYSPEESNVSSPSTISNTGKVTDKVPQKKGSQWNLPLAPAFIICLIRKDLSKVWCELTASVRTRSMSDDFEPTLKKSRSDSSSKQSEMSEASKELLLCFRPITEGLPDSDITSSSNSREAEAMMRGDRSHGSNGSRRSNGSRSNGSRSNVSINMVPIGES